MPELSPSQPVNIEYLNIYLTKGVISSEKDIEAIRRHISGKLIEEAIQLIHSKQVTTCFELAQSMK